MKMMDFVACYCFFRVSHELLDDPKHLASRVELESNRTHSSRVLTEPISNSLQIVSSNTHHILLFDAMGDVDVFVQDLPMRFHTS